MFSATVNRNLKVFFVAQLSSTFTTLWANSAGDKFTIFFSYFSKWDNLHKKTKSSFWEKIRKYFKISRLLKFYPACRALNHFSLKLIYEEVLWQRVHIKACTFTRHGYKVPLTVRPVTAQTSLLNFAVWLEFSSLLSALIRRWSKKRTAKLLQRPPECSCQKESSLIQKVLRYISLISGIILTLSMLGKIFSRRHIKEYF